MSADVPTIFNFETHPIEVFQGDDGEPWFVGRQVCGALGLSHGRALARLDDDEKGMRLTQTPGGPQNVSVINEAGLYNLVLGSRKPETSRFRRWVTHEVLPTIQRTGSYVAPAPDGGWMRPDDMARHHGVAGRTIRSWVARGTLERMVSDGLVYVRKTASKSHPVPAVVHEGAEGLMDTATRLAAREARLAQDLDLKRETAAAAMRHRDRELAMQERELDLKVTEQQRRAASESAGALLAAVDHAERAGVMDAAAAHVYRMHAAATVAVGPLPNSATLRLPAPPQAYENGQTAPRRPSWSATEIATIAGVTPQVVGRFITELGMRGDPAHCEWATSTNAAGHTHILYRYWKPSVDVLVQRINAAHSPEDRR